METLPIEMLEVITQHLETKDLAACAAVCRQWREVFNDDSLWRQRCDVTLEETLRTTPCVVEPQFVSPETDSGTLSPIGQWRHAFMREKHLWNNWRRGNHRSVPFEKRCNTSCIITDHLIIRLFDCILSKHSNENRGRDLQFMIELYDVKTFPPTLLKQTTNKYDYWPQSAFKVHFHNNTLLLFYDEHGIAFDLQLNPENIMNVKYKINLPNKPSRKTISRFKITRSAILGIFIPCFSLHVWDLKEGTELKEETIPKGKSFRIFDIATSKTTDNAVIVVSSDEVDSSSYTFGIEDTTFTRHFHIYNSLELRYLSFTQECEGKYYGLECTIHYDYVALAMEGFLKVFNYQTHKQLTKVPLKRSVRNSPVGVIDDCFVFISGNTFRMFHPASQTTVTTIDLQVKDFRVVSNSVVQMIRNGGTMEQWKIRRHNQERLVVINKYLETNMSSTRAIIYLQWPEWFYYW